MTNRSHFSTSRLEWTPRKKISAVDRQIYFMEKAFESNSVAAVSKRNPDEKPLFLDERD